MSIAYYRERLEINEKLLYLNYAATAPVTRTTVNKLISEVELLTQPLGTHFYDTLNDIENARRLLATLMGINPKHLAFTLNTSMAISMLALSVRLKPGDVVLVPDNEFPSNYFPWLNLRNKGVICKTFTPNPAISLAEDLKQQDLSNVKLISISAVSYETGRLYELEEFVSFCRENQILSCLDAIQAIGCIPFDLGKIDPDFMCSAAQKWIMGPVGCGFLYAKPELLENLDVPYVGWTSHRFPETMALDSLEFPDEMTRFEPGLPNYLPIIGTAASLVELNSIGWDTIYNGVQNNTMYLRDSLTSAGFRLLVEDVDRVAGITSFYLPEGASSRLTGEEYDKRSIKVTARNGYVRVSPHFFNEKKELDSFLNATEAIFKTQRTVSTPTVRSIERSNRVEPVNSDSRKIMLLGAAGNLGSRLANLLAADAHPLYLVSRDAEKLSALANDLRAKHDGLNIQTRAVDFSDNDAVNEFIQHLRSEGAGQYHALINSCGEFYADLFHLLPDDNLGQSLKVNVEVPGRLIHLFLNTLCSPQAHGVMNIISSTGRCGSPLLANYGASNAALWTLGETLSREWVDTDLSVTSFVAPAMHSPLQKLMGRTALRYFRIAGGFDYEEPDEVAQEALKVFWQSKAVHVAKPSRKKLWTNALFPAIVSKRMRQAWRKNA